MYENRASVKAEVAVIVVVQHSVQNPSLFLKIEKFLKKVHMISAWINPYNEKVRAHIYFDSK